MKTVIARCSAQQVGELRNRFPAAVKARAIIIKGGTVTFDVPEDAQTWEASPQQVHEALVLSDLAADGGEGVFLSIIKRLAAVLAGQPARSIVVTD